MMERDSLIKQQRILQSKLRKASKEKCNSAIHGCRMARKTVTIEPLVTAWWEHLVNPIYHAGQVKALVWYKRP